MSISSTGLYGSATIVNSDLFNDVEDLKEQVTTLSTSYLDTTREHREDISQNDEANFSLFILLHKRAKPILPPWAHELKPFPTARVEPLAQ